MSFWLGSHRVGTVATHTANTSAKQHYSWISITIVITGEGANTAKCAAQNHKNCKVLELAYIWQNAKASHIQNIVALRKSWSDKAKQLGSERWRFAHAGTWALEEGALRISLNSKQWKGYTLNWHNWPSSPLKTWLRENRTVAVLTEALQITGSKSPECWDSWVDSYWNHWPSVWVASCLGFLYSNVIACCLHLLIMSACELWIQDKQDLRR